MDKRLRNAANASTVETPLRLGEPSSARLSQEALINMASFPGVRGEDITAYVLIPCKSCQINGQYTEKSYLKRMYPSASREGIILSRGRDSELSEFGYQEL